MKETFMLKSLEFIEVQDQKEIENSLERVQCSFHQLYAHCRSGLDHPIPSHFHR